MQHSENRILKKKLDDLWNKYEEEKDIVMLVTKSEVEKANAEEIATLQARLESTGGRTEELEGALADLEAVRSNLKD